MPRRIGDTPFKALLPGSIADDPTIKAAAAALDAAFAPSLRGIPDVLLFARLAMSGPSGMYGPLARLADLSGGLAALPEDVLDSLAWQLHVDGYEAAASYEDKRRMVDRSLLLHRRKGTPWAVAEALRALGYADARITEGGSVIRYDGESLYNGANTYASGNRWALFDVEVDLGDGMGISAASIQRLRVAIEAWKNVRSWLRAFSWRASISDDAIITDVPSLWAVRPVFADTRPWGFPLYNGEIYYNNGIFRSYDGRLAHDGKAQYKPWAPAGHLHNAKLDCVAVGVRPTLHDELRYQPRYDGALRHDGRGRYGHADTPALDTAQVSLATGFTESVPVKERVAASLSASTKDHAGRYHDGSLSYGQRHISIADGAFFYDGSRSHGLYGGKSDFHALRHDGRLRHDKSGAHSLWGWLPGASAGPVFTYQALSDSCAGIVKSAVADAFHLDDALAMRTLRYALHTGRAQYNGAWPYSAKEV